jgi:hypothetical protein
VELKSKLLNTVQSLEPADLPVGSDSSGEGPPSHKALIPDFQRDMLADRLESEGAVDLASHLRNCGVAISLVCTSCGDKRGTEIRCRKRWCPVCAPAVAKERLRRWKGAVSALQWPLFMTLTIRNSEDPESVRFLRESWGKFRRRKLIRERVAGGVAAVEVTNNGKGWHPHLHAVVDCRWLALYTREPNRGDSPEVVRELCTSAAQELGALWASQVRQETASVQVARVTGDQATVYALKYATKAAELLAVPGEIAPMIRVLRKTRLVSGFGCLHPLPAVDVEAKPGVCCECCGAESQWMPETVVTAAIHKNQSHAATIGRTLPPSKQVNPRQS